MMVPKPKKAVAYGRVSRLAGREGESFQSFKQQTEAIDAWAAANGVEIVARFEDADVSGGTIDRPAFKQALALIEAGEADTLVTAKLDRFARNLPRAYEAIERLEAADATFVAVADQFDLSTPTGRLMFNILASFAQFELERVASAIQASQADAIDRGVHIGPTPLGYQRAGTSSRTGKPQGRLVPDPETAPIVQEAFRRAGREGLAAAVEYLRAELPEQTWTTVSVRRLLANRTYLGEVSYADLRGPKDPKDRHEPLVKPAAFRLAQSEPRDIRTPSALFPLSGVATCAGCGSPLVGSRTGKDLLRTYRCGSISRRHVQCTAKAMAMAAPLETLVRTEIARALTSKPRPEPTDPAPFEERLAAAEDERREFALDLDARELMGDENWRERLRLLAERVEDAEADYRAALERSRKPLDFGTLMWHMGAPSDAMADDGGEFVEPEFPEGLPTEMVPYVRRLVKSCVVSKRARPGQPLKERVSVEVSV